MNILSWIFTLTLRYRILGGILFFAGLFRFLTNWNHILSTLVALEFIALALFFLLTTLSLFSFEFFNTLFYLSIAVCEGALGLRILVLYRRKKGRDKLSSSSFLKW